MSYNKMLTFYDEWIGENPDIERKGKTMPYTSANGYMFTLLNKAGEIGIRLPKERREQLSSQFEGVAEFISYGAVMREYVLIPASMYNELSLLNQLLVESYQFVQTKKPK